LDEFQRDESEYVEAILKFAYHRSDEEDEIEGEDKQIYYSEEL